MTMMRPRPREIIILGWVSSAAYPVQCGERGLQIPTAGTAAVPHRGPRTAAAAPPRPALSADRQAGYTRAPSLSFQLSEKYMVQYI